MAKAKTTPEEVVDEVTPVEQAAPVEIAPVLLNEVAPERIYPGHHSRDFTTPSN